MKTVFSQILSRLDVRDSYAGNKVVTARFRVLSKVFTARLSKRLVFWVFISIVVVEIIILIPSLWRRKQELLSQLSNISSARVEVLQLTMLNTTNAEILTKVGQLTQNPAILGVTLYQENGQLLGSFGEESRLSFAQIKDRGIEQLESSNRYDIAHNLVLGKQKFILILHYDISKIQRELYTFIGRIAALVLIISVFVTIITMIVLERTLITPILLLWSDLIKAEEAISKEQFVPEFRSTSYQYKDELGEVIFAFQQMFQQFYQEIYERKQSELALQKSENQLCQQTQQLQQSLTKLQQTQAQLIQNEKMSSLGQMVAGIAHEINNPVTFIYGNLDYITEYTKNLLNLVEKYQKYYPDATPEIQAEIESIEFDFLSQDLKNIVISMKTGAERIRKIVLSLRTFSRLDEAELKAVDIHEGIDSILMILQHRLKQLHHSEIQVVRKYGNLPSVECYVGEMNQVFMNIIVNAIDVLEEWQQKNLSEGHNNHSSNITISTGIDSRGDSNSISSIYISIADNGAGMNQEVRSCIFDPFFTTKDVGKGSGLGLFISYQVVVERHQGKLECNSTVGKGTEFIISIPLQQSK